MNSLIENIRENYAPSLKGAFYLTFQKCTSEGKEKEHSVFLNFKGLNELNQKVKDVLYLVTCNLDNVIKQDSNKAVLSEVNYIHSIDFWDFLQRKAFNTDLSYIKIPGSDLQEANLANTNLSFSDFSGANLKKANLENSIIHFSNFERANLSSTNLHLVDFSSSDLRRCDLTHSDARDTNFSQVALRGAELWGSLLWNSNFTGSFQKGVDMNRGDYRGNTI